MEMKQLGGTSFQVSALGVGVWSWGARSYWGYGRDFGLSDVREAFQASLDAGLNFFDTAEIYAGGVSERMLGDLVRETKADVVVASKFAPFPWRVTKSSLHKALDATLARLGLDHVELYQVHFPYSVMRLEPMMQALADAVKAGKIGAVGVSNYGAAKMRRAHEALARRGVPLAANQVKYSLLDRRPEADGVLQTCRELNVTLIAHTPLAQGLLTGKYRPGTLPRGIRRFRGDFRPRSLRKAMPVVAKVQEIAEARGKTPGQVALNWLLRQDGVVPIPGAKTGQQARDNAGAAGWELTPDEVEALDQATSSRRR